MIGHIITLVVCAPLALGMIAWAILLFLGKGYRSIAGNSNALDEEVEHQKDTNLGTGVGAVLIVVAIVPAALCLYSVASLLQSTRYS